MSNILVNIIKNTGNARLIKYGLGAISVGTTIYGIVRQLRKMSLNKQVVLIMGGSRGLALEIARVVTREGAIVVLAARDREELDRARAILDLPAERVHTIVCDVTNEEQVKETVETVQRQYGEIDVLLNVAGLIEAGAMEVQTNEDYQESIATHLWGPMYSINAVLPSMRARKRGRIVNISSIAGLVSVPHLLPYSTSKHALVGYSEGLRSELLKDNIFVTTVCPGLMRTGSPRNADMKGNNVVEYALFSLLDALPFTSIDAQQAAQQIVEAFKHGDTQLIITIQAKALHMVHALVPEAVIDMFGLVNMFLPAQGEAGTTKVKGKDSESVVAPSLLTKLSDAAAVRNNEMGQKS
jgi:NAD(P)-dependent dehydrogenase (short-subunit alcohol dehydrogenase family)